MMQDLWHFETIQQLLFGGVSDTSLGIVKVQFECCHNVYCVRDVYNADITIVLEMYGQNQKYNMARKALDFI